MNNRWWIPVVMTAVGAVAGILVVTQPWDLSGSTADATRDLVAPVPASEVERLGESLDAEGQAALADMEVMRSEYVAAVDATVACIRAAGFPVIGPEWIGERYQYTVGGFDTRKALVAAKPLIGQCYDQHLRGIDLIWQGFAK